MRQQTWAETLAELASQIELQGPSAPKEVARRDVKPLSTLRRIEESCVLLNRIDGASPQELDEVPSSPALEYFGRWGTNIDRFRAIPHGAVIVTERLAAVLVLYFPQFSDLRQRPCVLTETRNSRPSSEIQFVACPGIPGPTANYIFQPSRIATRGEFAAALSCLTHIVGATAN